MVEARPGQDVPEEGAAGAEDHLVSLDEVFSTRQSHIKQLLVSPEIFEGAADVLFKIIPLQTELLSGHLQLRSFFGVLLLKLWFQKYVPVIKYLRISTFCCGDS